MVTVTPARKTASCALMIIVRDSERTIRPCLDSAMKTGAFQQMIFVLDSRTKDRTPEILYTLAGVRPEVEIDWHVWDRDQFAGARNAALGKAKTDYGFWMDSDDILLDPDGVKRLLYRPMGAAYYFHILIPNPWGAWSNTRHIRLFPIRPGVVWELPVHEQLAFSLRRLGIPEIGTPYRVLHTGYLTEGAVDSKHRRNYRIMSDWLHRNRTPGPERGYLREQFLVSQDYLRSVGGDRKVDHG